MRWRLLSYLHWRVEPAVVQASLPDGLTVDTFDGSAWVGLIPFVMRDVRPPFVPAVVPYVGDFPETNVRTYTVTADGRRGVYFHSLEASRLVAVAIARSLFDLPYRWAAMSVRTSAGRVRYSTRRRWPDRPGLRADVAVRVGERLGDDRITPLDDFLTARWQFHAVTSRGPVAAQVHHGRWPLHEAVVEHLDDDLLAAAGYPGLRDRAPDHVRFSPGVDVRAGPATVVGTARAERM